MTYYLRHRGKRGPVELWKVSGRTIKCLAVRLSILKGVTERSYWRVYKPTEFPSEEWGCRDWQREAEEISREEATMILFGALPR